MVSSSLALQNNCRPITTEPSRVQQQGGYNLTQTAVFAAAHLEERNAYIHTYIHTPLTRRRALLLLNNLTFEALLLDGLLTHQDSGDCYRLQNIRMVADEMQDPAGNLRKTRVIIIRSE